MLHYFRRRNGKLCVESVGKDRNTADIEKLEGFVGWVDPDHKSTTDDDPHKKTKEFWEDKI